MITSLIYDILFGSSISVITVNSVYHYLLPEDKPWPVLAYTLFTLIGVLFVRHTFRKQKIAAILGGSLWLVITILFSLVRGNRMFSHENIWLFNAIIAALAIALFSRIRSYSMWIGVGVSAVFTGLSVWALAVGKYPDKASVCAAFFVICLTVAELIQRSHRKFGDDNPVKHLVSISPFIFILILGVYFSPAPDKPYDWKTVINLYQTVRDRVNGIIDRISPGDGGNSAESFMGFSENGLLGTHIEGKTRTIMKVTTGAETAPSIYIKGKTFDEFTGREWKAVKPVSADDTMADIITLVTSVRMTDEGRQNDYYRGLGAGIKYERTYTRRFLAPAKTNIYSSALKDLKLVSCGGDVLFEKKKGINTEYNAFYLIENVDREHFDVFVTNAPVLNEKEWVKTLNTYGLDKKEGYGFADYLKWHDEVYEVYGDDIVLSDELETVLDDLFKDGHSDFEKLLLLEKEMSGYGYDIAPGEIPDTVQTPSDFLDYFMLEQKNGYCSYYATAFVLIARSMGHPARYVQGYNVSTPARSVITVTNKQAHAWPEVYFDNVGWISFEPTPGFSLRKNWMTYDELQALYEKNGRGEDFSWEEYYASHRDGEPEDFEIIEETVEQEESFFKWYYPLVVAVCALFITIVAIIIDNGLNRKKIKKLDRREFALYLCTINMKMLKILGYPMGNNETLEEYEKRLDGDFSAAALEFTGSFERLLYAGHVDYDREIEIINRSGDRLDGILRDDKKLLYYYYRLRLVR